MNRSLFLVPLVMFGCQSSVKLRPTLTPVQEGPVARLRREANDIARSLVEKLQQVKAAPRVLATPGGTTEAEGLPGLPLAQFMLVIDGGGYQAVLSEDAEDSWAQGAPRFVFTSETLVVRRDVSEDALPAALSAWKGQTVRLYSEEGARCEATVEGFSLLMRASHEDFSEELALAQGGREALSLIAKEVWASENQKLLTASLSFTQGCGGARFARLASLPAPTLAKAVSIQGDLSKKAISALRRTSEYAGVQRSYHSQMKMFGDTREVARWDTLDGAAPQVYAMTTPGEGEPLLWVSASAGYYSCDGAVFNLEGAFQLKNNAGKESSLEGFGEPSDLMLTPLAAIDVDNDGIVEILTEEALYRLQDGTFQEWASVETPTFAEEYCGE